MERARAAIARCEALLAQGERNLCDKDLAATTGAASQRSFTIQDSPASLSGSMEGVEAQALKSTESVPPVTQLQSDLTGLAMALEPYTQAAAAKINVDHLSQADQQEQVRDLTLSTPHESTCRTQAASRCSGMIKKDLERRFEEQAGNMAGNNCNNQLDDSERYKVAMESQRLEAEQVRSGERASSPQWRGAGLMLECPPATNVFDSILFGLTRAEAAEKQLQQAERNLKSSWESEQLSKAQFDTLARKVEESNKLVEDLRMQLIDLKQIRSSEIETEKKLIAQVAAERGKAHELERRVNELQKVAEEKLRLELEVSSQREAEEQLRGSEEGLGSLAVGCSEFLFKKWQIIRRYKSQRRGTQKGSESTHRYKQASGEAHAPSAPFQHMDLVP
jgi:hypothetical protein